MKLSVADRTPDCEGSERRQQIFYRVLDRDGGFIVWPVVTWLVTPGLD